MKRQTWMLSLVTCLLVVSVVSAAAQDFTDPSAWEQVIRGTGPFLEVTPSRVTITLPTQSLRRFEFSDVCGICADGVSTAGEF
jgi:hypothetical protein